ncbi:30S ribosomal protein S20, chloroplastic [Dendrobium catenatum]|uniref:30S ribosomal protein S20, chloroplastic n=1 Tax=Dendrobium catenatum TaxID=906689 RepID=A0A2I0XJJ3_9ASPA|nr:30S ribosomal protein S20, chloroplastic [Dendrobium catenatum]
MRRSVVCEAATTKKPDSASKRARQAEKRRIYNKAKKSEVKTRMRKKLALLCFHNVESNTSPLENALYST